MKENENDPVLFTMDFQYKTGHNEYVTINENYYDAEEGMHVVNKCSDCHYIKDKLNFHYSGKVIVADTEGFLEKDIPEFRREHKSIKDFIKYIATTDTLTIQKRDDDLKYFNLWGENNIDIHSYCVTRRDEPYWNIYNFEIGYKDADKSLKGLKLTDRIPLVFFMQTFSRWLYGIDKTLDAQTVFDIFRKDYKLLHPDEIYIDVKPMIDNIEAFEDVYTGFCNYERHKQDKEIEEAERQLEELKQKKYSNTVAGFNL